jgi:hypothetical protein
MINNNLTLKYLLIIIIVLCAKFTTFFAVAQDTLSTVIIQDELVPFVVEPLDTLIMHMTREHNERTAAAVGNYNNLRGRAWLHLVPSLGYDAFRNAPIVTISSSQVIEYFTKKDNKKYQVIQLQQAAENELQKKIYQLRALYLRLKKQLLELETRANVMKLNEELFNIDRDKYASIEISSEEYLQSQKVISQQRADYQSFKLNIFQTISDIEYQINRALFISAPLLETD